MSTSPNNGFPWLSATKYGASGLIAFYLVYLNGQMLPVIKDLVENVWASTQSLVKDHQDFKMILEPMLNESNRIQCAACWNVADNADEIKRCSCNPKI